MIARGCRHEDETRSAAASGRWPETLTSHADSCPACRDIVAITMLFAGGRPAMVSNSVSPNLIWARARHLRRARAEALASRIVTVGQLASGLVGLGAVTFVASRITEWPALLTSAASEFTGPVALMGALTALTAVSMLAMFGWVSRHQS